MNLRHLGRRILGLDRSNRKATKRGSRPARRTDPSPDNANPFLTATTSTEGSDQPTTPAAPERVLDFEISKAKPAIGALAGRLVIYAVLVVVLLAGLNTIARNVFSNPTTQTVTTDPGIDRAQAAAVAGRFTADYLSHDPTHPTDDPAVVQLVADGDSQSLSWSGTSWMAADVVIPGEVVLIDDRHAVVAVQARALLAAAPAHSDSPAPSTATTSANLNGNASIPPDGFSVIGALWLSLQVPLVRSDGHLAVAPSGPVFAVSPPEVATAASLSDVDAGTTSATREWATTLFTSFTGQAQAAAMTYLTEPGQDIATLGGAVSLQRLQSWSITSLQPSGLRFGTATVIWSLPAADLTIQQRYRVTTTSHDQRWFASAVDPVPAQ